MTAVTALPAALEALRADAAAQFAAAGYPTTKLEDWRFTPVQPIARVEWAPAPEAEADAARLEAATFGQPEWPRLVFVNGRFDAARSHVPALPEGVRIGSLADILATDPAAAADLGRHVPLDATPFTALNTAQFADGAFVQVPAGVELAHPVHLVFVTAAGAAGSAAHPRNLILIGRNAKVALVESYLTQAEGEAYFANPVSEIVVAENAWVEHVRIQRDAESAYHVGLTHVEQARDSHYRSFTFAMGGAIARHDLRCKLNAENVESLMYGLYFGRGDQLVDNHTTIFHDHAHCRSWEVYKGILDDTSHGVFNGKIFVQPEAQKTDAKQTNRALLLAETAKIDTKPQLEIFADDVKCTHGATVGFLNDQMLFYLKSRAIPEAVARRHLTYAFAAEVIAEVAIGPVREELDRIVRERVYGA